MARYLYIILLLVSMQAYAAPDGADLLRACKTSINNGFEGIEGMMCEYYLTPCSCKVDESSTAPRFCPPAIASTADLAALVIDGLNQSSGLLDQDAQTAAAVILAKIYPCTD